MVLFGIMQLYLNMNLEKRKVSSLTKAEGKHIGHASCKSLFEYLSGFNQNA